MLTIYPGPGNMATIQMVPIDHETTLAVYTYYFRDENLTQEEKDLVTFAEQVRQGRCGTSRAGTNRFPFPCL
ncbi:hypothetical protein RCO48_37955 [Peribacillus frigoritolerans]|nr:hypothetical protein [Peribacillus frigoritolerans]